MIKIKLKNLGRIYESEGETPLDALSKLEVRNLKGLGVLTVIDGDKERVKILKASILAGLFGQGSPTRKSIALKQFSILFD